MAITLPLKKMSRSEKLRAMEALWADLTAKGDQFDSPDWHADALGEAERCVKGGKAKFSDWQKAKERIRRKASRRGRKFDSLIWPKRICWRDLSYTKAQRPG